MIYLISFKSRKRKPKDVEEESKNLQGSFIESLTSDLEKTRYLIFEKSKWKKK